MRNKPLQPITSLALLCMLCFASILSFIPASSHAKSAGEVFETASQSTVVILGYDGKGKVSSLGSGVVMPDGSVATNCHVVEKATRLEVRYQKERYPASRLYTDWDRDTCSLSVQGLKAPAVRPGTTRGLKVGARVYAIGAPQGLELTISEGVVSSLRELKGGQYIQTTAPISPGSSGGGLFDEEGRLLGLTTFYLTKGQNLNFALPVEWIGELPKRHAKTAKKATRTVHWLNKAIELYDKKDWREMIAHCQRWTAAEPGNAYAWFNLGLAYGESGQTSMAIESFQRSLRIDPEYAKAWTNLGAVYVQSGQKSRAIESFQRSLRIDPEDAKAWYNLGLAYGLSNQTSREIESYQKALRIDPEDAKAWNNLGAAYVQSGQTSRAIEYYQRALRIDPEYAGAWYNLGVAYKVSGQKSRVTEVYQRLKRLDPKWAEKFFKEIVLP